MPPRILSPVPPTVRTASFSANELDRVMTALTMSATAIAIDPYGAIIGGPTIDGGSAASSTISATMKPSAALHERARPKRW